MIDRSLYHPAIVVVLAGGSTRARRLGGWGLQNFHGGVDPAVVKLSPFLVAEALQTDYSISTETACPIVWIQP